MIGKQASLLTVFLLAGCTTLEGKPTATSPCPFEQVWDTSIAALEGVPLQAADKAAGVVETNWVEVEASTQAGIMQRDVTKERARYVVEGKREGTGAAATVLQLREAWSPMGVKMNQGRAGASKPRGEAGGGAAAAPAAQATG